MIIRNSSAVNIMLEYPDYSYYDLMDSTPYLYTTSKESLSERYRSFRPIGPTMLVEWNES